MRLVRGLPASAAEPIALTIGNFDGVHRGHQAMLARLCEAAEDLRLPSAAMTFDPHPREFFAPDTAPPRLSSTRTKLELFRAFGVAQAHVVRFDARLASLTADAFVDEILVRCLGVRWVLVGDDFRFGRGRGGDLATLRAHANTFSVEAMTTVEIDGERASSTAVRAALAAGDLARATALLGRPYSMSGRVVHGRKLGRTLGFPTANLPLRHKPPLAGVFAVRVHGIAGGPRDGVASVGVRPTVTSDNQPVLEVFVFDFQGALYGRRLTVEFLHKLRDEARYPSLEALVAQMNVDAAQARGFLAAANADRVEMAK